MKKNLELKAYCTDPEKARGICASLGARPVGSFGQTDTYFAVPRGRLKFRRNKGAEDMLIHYDRANTPTARECSFETVPISPSGDGLLGVLTRSLGVRTTVLKQRTVLEWRHSLINIDHVKGLGDFIEIEVDIREAGGYEPASAVAVEFGKAFGISPAEILPWSYAEMQVMYETASVWRKALDKTRKPGRLFLFDGPSCSGKTTIVNDLAAGSEPPVSFVTRYCTRKPRQTQGTESEYVFVSYDEFAGLAAAGSFIEYRDYLFGMSYGLPWDNAVSPLLEGKNVVGIINLGNVLHVKKIFPEAVIILITAPEETIRRRLVKRGFNREEQIEERLSNAHTVSAYRRFYDYIVENDDGMLLRAGGKIRRIITSCSRD